jgi:hypothetical protein
MWAKNDDEEPAYVGVALAELRIYLVKRSNRRGLAVCRPQSMIDGFGDDPSDAISNAAILMDKSSSYREASQLRRSFSSA